VLTHHPRPVLALVTALPVAACTMALVSVLHATHPLDLGPDLIVGLLLGLPCWLLVLLSSVMGRLTPKVPTILSAPLLPIVLLGVAALALGKPVPAVLVIAGPALLAAAAVDLVDRIRGLRPPGATLIVALALLALGLGLVVSPLSSRPTEIRASADAPDDLLLLTWNIGLAPPDGGPSRRTHLAHIARVIRRSRAHVVCLQELRDASHLQTLLQHLGPAWTGSVAGPGPKVTAVLSRIGGTPIRPADSIRVGTPVGLVLATPHGALHILSLHIPRLDLGQRKQRYVQRLTRYARGAGEPLWSAERSAQNVTARGTGAVGGRVVLAGDINTDPESWGRAAAVFSDVELDRRLLAALSRLGCDVGRGGVATGVPSRRIDRVFLPRGTTLRSYRVLPWARRGWMDHRPIVVRFGVTGQATLQRPDSSSLVAKHPPIPPPMPSSSPASSPSSSPSTTAASRPPDQPASRCWADHKETFLRWFNHSMPLLIRLYRCKDLQHIRTWTVLRLETDAKGIIRTATLARRG